MSGNFRTGDRVAFSGSGTGVVHTGTVICFVDHGQSLRSLLKVAGHASLIGSLCIYVTDVSVKLQRYVVLCDDGSVRVPNIGSMVRAKS